MTDVSAFSQDVIVYCQKRDCFYNKPCPNNEFGFCNCDCIEINKDGKCNEGEEI